VLGGLLDAIEETAQMVSHGWQPETGATPPTAARSSSTTAPGE
jgi:hypothetical protein